MNTSPPFTPMRRSQGFTLLEVLIALGILAIGITATASLFPTAALLQKQAVNETLRQNHIRSGDAILGAVGLENTVLLEYVQFIQQRPTGLIAYDQRIGNGLNEVDVVEPEFDVYALAEIDNDVSNNSGADIDGPDMVFTNVTPAPLPIPPVDSTPGEDRFNSYVYEVSARFGQGRFPVGMRSLPTSIPAVEITTDNVDMWSEREVFYVPLVRQGIEASEIFPDWSVYMFVLQPPSQLRTRGEYASDNPSYSSFTGLTCANPLDGPAIPKVFRVPVAWDEADPNVAEPVIDLDGFVKPGELVLGDNGKIYRVGQLDPSPGSDKILLASQTLFEPINERDLTAIWVAPAPGGANQATPLGDLKLLSNGNVRVDEF